MKINDSGNLEISPVEIQDTYIWEYLFKLADTQKKLEIQDCLTQHEWERLRTCLRQYCFYDREHLGYTYSWSTKKWPRLEDTILVKDIAGELVLFETVAQMLKRFGIM